MGVKPVCIHCEVSAECLDGNKNIDFFQSDHFQIFKNLRKGSPDLQEVIKRIPECPICFEKFKSGCEVFQCGQGHFICGKCRSQVQSCPRCRSGLIGRCHDFEHF